MEHSMKIKFISNNLLAQLANYYTVSVTKMVVVIAKHFA